MEEKEKFAIEFYRTCEILLKSYPSKNEQEKDIIGCAINSYLHQMQADIEKMNFIDFYKKYITGSLYLDCEDFTKSEVKNIIEESPLSERDRKLALLYWYDLKSEDDIAAALDIDRKTVRNNIPKISMILKKTASKIYK